MPVAQDQELVSVAEAASRFGVSGPAIREWVRRGLITPYWRELPRQLFVDAREIERKRQIKPRGRDE